MKVLMREASILEITTREDGDTLVNLSLLLTPERSLAPPLSRRDLSTQVLDYLIKLNLDVKQAGMIEVDEIEYESFIEWRKANS